VTALSDSVAALAEAADQRPQTTDLAVARLKKFLPDPAHRIRLHDLIDSETKAAISHAEGLEVTRHVPDPQERLRQTEDRMDSYREACAALLNCSL